MALRALMKRKELDRLNAELETLRNTAAGFEAREADIATMIEEAETDEERSAVQEEIESFEAERDAANAQIAELEERVSGIENELDALEEEQEPQPQEDPVPVPAPETEERNFTIMNKRNIFRTMTMQERTALFEREDVKGFLAQVRTAIKEKRALSGTELLIPEVFLGLIRENIEEYSKLYKHVNVRTIGGNGRAVVMGTIPEAVWTDCCGILNELSLQFNDAEVNCWKVGGYFDVCNATLEDSEIDLASELLTVLGQAIGFALDKAILFGLGTRMPLGVFTRLAQTSQPADYPQTARTWVDLHTSNIKTISAANSDGVKLFKEIVKAFGNAKGKYSRGEKVFVMNEKTHTTLMAEAMSINAAGAIATGIGGTMPVVGGAIEVLDFMPDDMIIAGYFDLFLLGDRANVTITQSEHVRFIEDRTVFKGTARYDGLPVIAEGFVAIGINNTTPSASSISFAPDTANAEESGS